MDGEFSSGREVKFAKVKQDTGAEGWEVGKPSGGVLEALDDGINPFRCGIGDGMEQIVHNPSGMFVDEICRLREWLECALAGKLHPVT